MNTLNEITNSNEMPQPTLEKKNWVSPEISNWNAEQIENIPGIGPDGGVQTYL